MKVRNLLLTVCGFILPFALWAQRVEGTVVSAAEDAPAPFVSIVALPSNNAAVSDLDGYFKIAVNKDDKWLIVSAVGFRQDTLLILPSPMHIVLQPSSKLLEEVVVTALGIKREKKSLGYAITEVNSDALNRSSDANVINKLSGKVAGLQISATNGGVGASNRIILRGNNSITGDNQALIVVDGVPINNSTISTAGGEWGGRDYGNGVGDLNADDIESVSVLKGASASALYGSQAMDGVILITTKNGTLNKPLSLSLSSQTSIDRPYIHYKLQNKYGAGRNGKFEGAWDVNAEGVPVYNPNYDFCKGSWGPAFQGQTIIDWDGKQKTFEAQPNNYKDFFQTGITTNNALGLDGGNDFLSYRLSVADNRTLDIIPALQYRRNNVGLKLASTLWKKLRIETYVSYVFSQTKNRPGLSDAHDNPNRNYVHMPRHISTSSLENFYQTADRQELTWYSNWNWMTNPYWNIAYQKNQDSKHRYFGHAMLKYEVTKGLDVMLRAAPDYSRMLFTTRDAVGGLIYGLGRYAETQNRQFLINSDFLITYNSSLSASIKYSINAGGNAMYFKNDNNEAHTEGGLKDAYNYNLENSVNPIYRRRYLREAAKNSLYAFGQLSWKDLLFLDITARNDWSSTLPKGKNVFFYPSFSLGFVFSELMHKQGVSEEYFSFGKWRVSYAGVGNDAEPYQLETTYEIIDNQGYGEMAFISPTVPNLGLLPELVNSFETGIETKFFMNRLGLDITYYNTRSHNQITSMPVSATSGYYSAIVNSGIIQNRGWELQLNASPIRQNHIEWDLNLAYAKNSSEILQLAPNVERAILYEHWRLSVEARPGNPYGDIVGYGFKRNARGQVLVDAKGMFIRDEVPKVLGNATPDFSLSLGSQFRYKNLSFAFLLHSQIGGDMFSGTNMYGNGYAGNFQESLEGREAWYASEAAREIAGVSTEDWVPTGGYLIDGVYAESVNVAGQDVSGQLNHSFIDPYQYYYKLSKWQEEVHEPFIYDATYVKLRELSVDYQLPKIWAKKMGMSELSVGLFATNLWLIYSKVPNLDPETLLTNGNGQGYELYSYPNKRSFGFSLKLNI